MRFAQRRWVQGRGYVCLRFSVAAATASRTSSAAHQAAQLSQSMAVAALEAMAVSPSPLQVNHMATAHGRILELLAAEVGRVVASSERGVSK